MAAIVSGILGSSLLLFGRKLFWLFVGAVGFGIGLQFTERFWHGSSTVGVLVALAAGVVFALLAILFQTLAIGAAGFLAGAYIFLSLAGSLGVDRGILTWVLFLMGGVLGAILIRALLDWALITLSSLAGASMIAHAVQFGPRLAGLIALVLFIVGVAVQGASLRQEKRGKAGDD
jgi:hypothetical protein